MRTNQLRIDTCRDSLAAFCSVYLPAVFYEPMTVDRLYAMRKVEMAATLRNTVIGGDRHEDLCLERGRGVTSICMAAAMWVACYGHRRFPLIVTHDQCSAQEILEEIGVIIENQIQSSGHLLEDFPILTDPEKMPVISAYSIQDNLRGIKQRVAGVSVRPDLILLDNPVFGDPLASQSVARNDRVFRDIEILRSFAPSVHLRTIA